LRTTSSWVEPPIGADQLGPALNELVGRAAAIGLDVQLHLSGQPDHVTGPAATVTYRVVQEGVTNALKHAPGAPIHVSVDCRDEVSVDVFNSTSSERVAPLREAGGGHGLTGIQERVAGLGGTCQAGPDPGGYWRVSVRFPVVVAR
jgi:signal transduction histidine kinase